MKKKKLEYIIMIATFLIDYITKYFLKNKSFIIIKNFLTIKYTRNYGAAWSILTGQRVFLIILSLIFLGLIVYYSFKFQNNKRNNIAFGLLLGGLLGNLFDRLFFGYVRDFISFQFGRFYYPIFNIADVAIVISIILLGIAIIKKEDNYEKA